jgi:ATP-dependent exoDNAse (exonuclease V) beta subunit
MEAEKPNVLIEASAGTGKTQALAERLIELSLAGVEPSEIVALTFSRAAAGEIFERFVSLLAERASADRRCAELLRKVVSTQHLSQVGTLDSFLMRIARTFPLELGLDGRAEIMDDYGAGQELARISFGILRRTDRSTRRAFADAFALAMNGEDVRSFVESYRSFIRAWHRLLLEHPEKSAWGDPAAIWGGEHPWPETTEEDLARFAAAIDGICEDKAWPEFVAWVRDFRGSFDGVKGFAKKFFELGGEVFAHATLDVKFGKKTYSFGGERAWAVREALLGVCGYVVRQKLALARGVYTLIAAYEAEYGAKVRGAGKLVFDDVPRLLARMPEDVRLALEYRLDARIRAWALDEFQDTSRGQWRALGPLVEEAKQSDGEKSVFVVGDRKQAIYGWREGDVGIFRREAAQGEVYTQRALNKTYRSSPAVVEAVNRVFVRGRLRECFPGWEADEHVSAKPDMPGFVQAVEASGRYIDDYLEPIRAALAAVDPVARGISAAVLVRSNGEGERIASYLKLNGMDGVVWEGESAILDTPALQGFVDLVRLADHPGYQQAYRHFASTPVAAAMYPDGVPDASEVSRLAAQAFTAKGLVRAFRDIRALLPEDPSVAWSEFTEERFTDMLRAAAEFEFAMEPGTRLSDFADFLAAKKKRNLAEPGKVRIMTIHRSKGLGFDYVVLPLYEKDALNKESDGPLVADGWVVPNPGGKVSKMLPGLAAARADRQERAEEEALCVYYVAMTRAKMAMTVVCRPPAKAAGSSIYMSDFVREALPEPIGDAQWYLRLPAPEARAESAADAPRTAPRRAKRQSVKRRLPSLALRSGMSAGDLFADFSARSAAKRRGTEAHARYEAVEWVDPSAPRDDVERAVLANGWTDAFVKGGDAVALWRERSYELLVGGKWESGQFDRVVFRGEGAARRATVYDFKTNAKRRDETVEDFARRMAETYAGQMASYRAAVSALADIPPERVKTVLLLTETGAAVLVEGQGHFTILVP